MSGSNNIHLPASEDIREGKVIAIHRDPTGVYVREARDEDIASGVARRDYKQGEMVPL